ncbi:MAG: DUF3604 domain-containing protein, partial [Candidatus Helarchaeales archaeon]
MFFWSSDPNIINYRTIFNNTFSQFWIKGPSVVQKGEQVKVSVQAWDDYERLCTGYFGSISISDYIYNFSTGALDLLDSNILDAPYQFSTFGLFSYLFPRIDLGLFDNGMHVFSGIKFTDAGIHYLKVQDQWRHSAFSNPIIVTDGIPEHRIYWGDIHGHTAMSDGTGTLEQAYTYARDVARLDFVAITDHDIMLDIWNPFSWELEKYTCNLFNSPPDFVTLVAYEWTAGFPTNPYGHINVYYKGSDGVMLPNLHLAQYGDPDKLWHALRTWKQVTGSDVITITHHTACDSNNKYDWSYYDPEFMPLVEIYSCHGSSECMASEGNPRPLRVRQYGEVNKHGYYVRDALAMGYRVGIMCSSDTHDGRLGHPLLHTALNTHSNYPLSLLPMFRDALMQEGSLVAVKTDSLSRETIFDGLKSRSCYGTTHVNRMILNFSINGFEVGYNRSELVVPTINSVENISFFAIADGYQDFQKVEIFRNNEIFCLWNSTGIYNSTHKVDNVPLGPVLNYTLDSTNFNFTITGTSYNYGLMKNGQ